MLVLTHAQNILKSDKFAFKGDKSRVVRRTFWLIKVVPTWKKFEKRCFTQTDGRHFTLSWARAYCIAGIKLESSEKVWWGDSTAILL
jgi:hypothetical protein